MSQTIIVVARQMKVVPYPVEERDLGIGVMSADKKNAGMQEDQCVNKCRELKTAVGKGER